MNDRVYSLFCLLFIIETNNTDIEPVNTLREIDPLLLEV